MIALDDLISEELAERKIKYTFESFSNTSVLTVGKTKDVRFIENLLHVLCYKYATHEVSSKQFEILFN